MKIRRDMKIREVLEINEEKMLKALFWLAPQFERLRHPILRRAMSGRVTVEQAARIARVPLTEMLYVLNLAAGEPEEKISDELRTCDPADFEFHETNPPAKPEELRNLKDDDPRLYFIDLMDYHEQHRDPMPAIARGLVSLKKSDDVLLLKHPFDPIPLRDRLARGGFFSWAEERKPGEWYVYFYRPATAARAKALYSTHHKNFARAASSII